MTKIIVSIILALLLGCLTPESFRERHNYEVLDTLEYPKYQAIIFRCQDLGCYKLDTFKLYKQ
jgi:hypothetical protein